MPAFLPWLITFVVGSLRFVAGSLAVQVLVGLGIGVVTYTGIDATFDFVMQRSVQTLGGLPAELLGLMGYMKLGKCIGVIVAAYTGRFAMTAVRTAAGALAIKRFMKL